MHLERCNADVSYWWWLLILLDFAGVLFFGCCGYKVKDGLHIND